MGRAGLSLYTTWGGSTRISSQVRRWLDSTRSRAKIGKARGGNSFNIFHFFFTKLIFEGIYKYLIWFWLNLAQVARDSNNFQLDPPLRLPHNTITKKIKYCNSWFFQVWLLRLFWPKAMGLWPENGAKSRNAARVSPLGIHCQGQKTLLKTSSLMIMVS